jgi:hypothetical protein
MARDPFAAAHLSEIEPIGVWSSVVRAPVREHFDIRAFGANAFTAPAGELVVEEHDEVGESAGRHEELYFVAAGRALFTVDGDEIDAPAGTFIFVGDPAATRSAVAKDAETTVLAIGGERGVPYRVSPWELGTPSSRLYRAGDHAGAAALQRELVAEHPENATFLYNLACYEAMAGEREPALEHLLAACELETDGSLRAFAQTDTDLDPIRDDPAFPR